MRSKFSQLLRDDQKWKVLFNKNEYDNKAILSILMNNFNDWKTQGVCFNDDKYILAVGNNSFHFFLYTLFASAFNLKIIFSTIKQMKHFLGFYKNLSYDFIISPKKFSFEKKKVLTLNMHANHSQFSFENLTDNKSQGEIIFFTSGTTGSPKLVHYQEGKLFDNATMVGDYMGLHSKDSCLCMFPLNYMYGFSVTMSTLIKGGAVILERSTIFQESIVGYLKNYNVTLFPVVRSVIANLKPFIEKENLFFPNLRIINASDKIYVEHVKEIFKIAPIFWNNFGQTESGPRLFAVKIRKDEENELSKYSYRGVIAPGYSVPGVKIMIKNEKGDACKPYEVGELCYKTRYGMSGYMHYKDGNVWKDWRVSNDLVYKNKNGMVFWVGRKSQLIKIDGYFINVNLLHVCFDEIEFVKKSYFILEEISSNIHGFFSIDETKIKKEDAKSFIENEYKKVFPFYPRIAEIVFIKDFPKTQSEKININELNNLIKEKNHIKN